LKKLENRNYEALNFQLLFRHRGDVMIIIQIAEIDTKDAKAYTQTRASASLNRITFREKASRSKSAISYPHMLL
jgi:hypothetical protein